MNVKTILDPLIIELNGAHYDDYDAVAKVAKQINYPICTREQWDSIHDYRDRDLARISRWLEKAHR